MSSLTAEFVVAAGLAAAVALCTWRQSSATQRHTSSRSSAKQLIERMAPNVKGSGFEWKDPTRIYLDGLSFASTVDHLLDQLEGVDVEMVAGIDAAGYVLGAALASRLGVGFLCIRKGGSLPVATDEVTYSYSKGSGKRMEMRAGAFPPRCRVAVVDQWVDSGGSMRAAIELVERQQGVVAAVITLCCEEGSASKPKLNTQWLRENYNVCTLVHPSSPEQTQCNNQWLNVWGKKAA